jgi:hypothetical protein
MHCAAGYGFQNSCFLTVSFSVKVNFQQSKAKDRHPGEELPNLRASFFALRISARAYGFTLAANTW